MKKGVYSILKARFLVNEDATRNWRFIVFLFLLALLMIANTHRFEQKVFRITELTNEVKELRSEFVDKRSELMKLKMESTVSEKMEERKIFPSSVPPQEIKVKKTSRKKFLPKTMAVEDKHISYRIYLVAFSILLMTIGITFKLTKIQWSDGDYYRKLAKERTVRNFVIPANKGNVYSADGSLLATSIPNYNIRFDAVAPKGDSFDKNVNALADSLSKMLGKPSSFYNTQLRIARTNKNRYLLIARDLSYTQYVKIKTFPLFNLGANKGGIITEQETVREHPIGKIAERTIGYDRIDENGKRVGKGIEWSFRKYLNGKDGKVLKQKIAKGQWKPIRDVNEVDPQDGYDVISTIDVYIQDIAHHALLKQLKEYRAEHGCVVVMETKTGKIKAISNLGKLKEADSTYFETQNYAVAESHEPGSTFKLVDMIALLDDHKIDTSKVYDSKGGVVTYGNDKVRDSHDGGYGKISLARGFEVSSNTIMVQAVYENYKNNPQEFIDRISNMGLDKPLGLPFDGEGKPIVHKPGEKAGTEIPCRGWPSGTV
eukprot:Opistho-2@60400